MSCQEIPVFVLIWEFIEIFVRKLLHYGIRILSLSLFAQLTTMPYMQLSVWFFWKGHINLVCLKLCESFLIISWNPVTNYKPGYFQKNY